MRDGVGILEIGENEKYEGGWKEGYMSGYGEYNYPNG